MTRARHFAVTLLGVATFWFAGCAKTTDDVAVKADGSGSFTESTDIDMTAAAELGEAMRAFGPGMGGGERPPEPTPAEPGKSPEPGRPPEPGAKPGPDAAGADAPKPPADPLERMKLRWKDIPGLEVTKASSAAKDGRTSIQIEATFKTLEAYAQATNIEMGSTLVKNDDGSYTLKFELRGQGRNGRPGGERRGGPGMGDGPPGGMEDGGMDGGGMEPAAPGMEGGDAPRGPGGGMGAMMSPLFDKYMTGLEFTRRLKLPGTIVETNGTKSEDGTTVSWKLTYDDIKGGKVEPQSVTFKGEGLDLKPFTVKRSARRTFMGGPGGPVAPGAPGSPPGGPVAPGGDGK